MWFKKLAYSFIYAGRGFARVLRKGRNLRIHLTAAFYVCAAGILGRLDEMQWAAVFICFATVIGAELINTSIETLGNAVSQGQNRMIGAAKDIAAGAVLVCAVGAAAVAVCIFAFGGAGRTALETLSCSVPAAVILILTLPAALIFIKGRRTWI